MNAKMLLRGLSEIDPQYLERALRAASGSENRVSAPAVSGGTSDAADRSEIVLHGQTKHSRRLRYAGWAGAAACLLLMCGAAMLFFRHKNNAVLIPAVSEDQQIVEITGTAASAAATQTTVSAVTVLTQSGAAQSEIQTGETVSAWAPATETIPEASAVAPPQSDFSPQTTVTTAENMVTPPVSATTGTSDSGGKTSDLYENAGQPVPVLVAMGDAAGTLPNSPQITVLTDTAAIQRYLNGSDPVVTLGEGQKSPAVQARILENAGMLRVQWQTQDNRWEEYGISEATLDSKGVLHLGVCMYSGTPAQNAVPWIYETALLFENGRLPEVTDVQLDVQFYEEQDGGVSQWVRFNAKLQEDVSVLLQSP